MMYTEWLGGTQKLHKYPVLKEVAPPPYWYCSMLYPTTLPCQLLKNHLLLCPQNNNYILIHRSFVFLALYTTFQFSHNIMKSTWSLCFLTQHNTNHRRHLFCWHFPFSLFPTSRWLFQKLFVYTTVIQTFTQHLGKKMNQEE